MNIFVGDLQNDKDLELYGYSDNTEQYDENGLPLDGTTGYLNSTDNQLTGNLGDDNGYIYGELNRKVEHQTFTGKETETASTYVNNQSDTIEVNVKKTPKKLTIIDGSLVKTFDGSEDINIEISSVEGYATKADLEAEATLREQADKDITSKLDTEISNRESADNTLSEALETETEERISKDNQLQENITNLDTSIPEKVNQILQQGHYVSDENYVHTDNNFTDDDKTELDTLHQMRINDEFGKVDGVAVNDVEQPIENKIVKLTIDKSTVGLDKVDNTSDKDKPVSDAVQLELDSINTNLSSTQTDLSSFKEETNRNISDINSTITSEVTRINQELQTTTNNINTLDGKVDDHINNQNNPHNVTKEQIGLGNVDNTSDLNKPISTQTQTALDGLNQTITNNFNNLNSSIENETERATLAETEISTKLQQEMNTRVQEHAEIQGKIDTINTKIPNQASSTNQLADKAFVNSTINSSAAFFKGSFKSKAALDAVQWQTTDSSLENYVTNNDYAYVEADETHNNEAWRYIYVKDNAVSEWQPQFRVNESPFTQAQLDAINSGATADLINSIGSKLTQDAIVDSTGDSSIKAISQRAATLGINTVQSNLNTHILDKNNPHQVTKAQIGLGNVDNTSDLDKPVSTAVRAALNDYLLIANIDNSLNSTSVNPVQNKVLYDPVTFAESERQKSKNLFTTQNNNKYGSNATYNIINSNSFSLSYGSGNVTWSGVEFIINNLKPNTTYNFSLICNVSYSTLYFQFYGLNTASAILEVYGGYLRPFNTGDNTSIKIRISSGNSNVENTTFNITNVQLEEGSVATDYQPYRGQITHNGDAPVVFAESERQKSKNLFDYTKIKSLNYGITQADGIFTINTQFYYPSIDYDINLNQGETYTFSLNIDSYSNSDGSGVNSEIVLFNANGDTDTKGVGGVNSTGRYSMTFTPEFDVVRVEIRPIRKGNNTSTLTGTVSNLMLCVGEDRDYQPYNGEIIHDKQLTEQLSNYLPLSGGAMTGQIKLHTNGFRTNSDDGYYTDTYGNFIYLGDSNTANFQIKDNTATAQIKAFYKSGRIETNGGIRINASGATTATSEYPVDIRRSSSGGDTAIKVTRTDTEKSMYFGIGSGGENRGIYDLTKNSWQLHLDSSDVLHLASFTADGKITIGAGDNKAIQFSKGSYINYIGTSNTIFGIKSATDTVVVGHTSYPIEIRGSNTRPLYNDAELALKSDIISSDNFVTINTAQTITGKKTFNNSISIGSCTQTYNASTKSLVYSFE